MAQGVLPYKYEEERNDAGMTAMAGLPVYLDLAWGKMRSSMGCYGYVLVIYGVLPMVLVERR